MRLALYLRLGRVSNLPTVWSNVLAGVVLADGAPRAGTLVPLLAALSLFYVGGMFLNDAFDRDVDARERPERPIPSGRIGAAEVFGLGFAMFAVALGILGVHAASSTGVVWPTALTGLGLAGVITYYDAHHKRNPLSPLVMGLCRVLVYVLAAVAATGRLPGAVLAGSLVLLSYLIGLTYVAKQETLAEYRNLWPLAFLFAPFVYGLPALAGGLTGPALFAALLAWVCYSISFLVRRGRVDIPRAVVGFLAGISLLDALLIARHGAAPPPPPPPTPARGPPGDRGGAPRYSDRLR